MIVFTVLFCRETEVLSRVAALNIFDKTNSTHWLHWEKYIFVWRKKKWATFTQINLKKKSETRMTAETFFFSCSKVLSYFSSRPLTAGALWLFQFAKQACVCVGLGFYADLKGQKDSHAAPCRPLKSLKSHKKKTKRIRWEKRGRGMNSDFERLVLCAH